MIGIFRPPPPAAPLPAEQVDQTYHYWRTRLLYSTFIGYAVYYWVRLNIPLALAGMQVELGLKKADLGAILSLHGIAYGVSKFVNGIAGDRTNPRYFMALGLMLSALANLWFGLSHGLMVLTAVWVLNGWFQGLGFPPCARILAYWFAPKERGLRWGLWNCSHQIGGGTIMILAGFLAQHYGWRMAFLVPAGVAAITSLFLLERLRDTPESLGLPPVEVWKGEALPAPPAPAPPRPGVHPIGSLSSQDQPVSFWGMLVQRVFSNPYIWLACLANFMVYVVRYGFLNWAPLYLKEAKGVPLEEAGWMNAGFEFAGLFGALFAGWLSDRFFASRRAPVAVAYMLGVAAFIGLFWKLPAGNVALATVYLSMVGFCIYGPQFLVGVMVADQASKEAAATAIGLTGLFGYVSQTVSGYGLGALVDHYGWNGGFEMLMGCALIGALPFALCWNCRPKVHKSGRGA